MYKKRCYQKMNSITLILSPDLTINVTIVSLTTNWVYFSSQIISQLRYLYCFVQLLT